MIPFICSTQLNFFPSLEAANERFSYLLKAFHIAVNLMVVSGVWSGEYASFS